MLRMIRSLGFRKAYLPLSLSSLVKELSAYSWRETLSVYLLAQSQGAQKHDTPELEEIPRF